MELSKHVEYFSNLVGSENIKLNEPMKGHTSFKLGGPADILLTPNKVCDIPQVIKYCKDNEIPYFVMGNGSNLIVREKGIRGVVIKIFDNFSKIELLENNIIEVEAGVLLSKLSKFAYGNSLTGLEFASGIPGTVGGAVTMNAGAYGGEMKDCVIKTEFIDSEGNIKTITGDEHAFGYRDSFIQKQQGIVIKTWIKLEIGDNAEIKAKLDDLCQRRKDKQPLEMPSAGSVFKRPVGYFAGKLIEDSGFRGYSIGGAQVSEKHCGFIVNKGDATADDVLNLIKHIQNTVKDKFNVDLCTEVRIIGEE